MSESSVTRVFFFIGNKFCDRILNYLLRIICFILFRMKNIFKWKDVAEEEAAASAMKPQNVDS